MSIPQRWPNTTHREDRLRALAQVILESSVRPTHLSRRTTVAPPMQNFRMCLQISRSAVEDDVSALHHVSAAIAKASNDTELNAAFAALLREQIGALAVASDPYFDIRRGRIIAFAAQNHLPAIYHFRVYALEGGLINYGPSITEAYRQVGKYVARILKGDKPADLPILQPTKFDFVINLKTAKTWSHDATNISG